ncbi:hypothetical protein, partial [Dyella sp.]|uniref:hypothetical protein n=1 Tax=Dyella sp. TaxID=1869338 RepID=UPI002FDADDB9
SSRVSRPFYIPSSFRQHPKSKLLPEVFRGTFAKDCLVEGGEIIAPVYSPVKGRKHNLRKNFAQRAKRKPDARG